MTYNIVGVIGHIDHGKTSLVAALTGVDTDSHPEEKRRGITIDLGFASYADGDYRFALIDAPGHQRYIGNLLAGVSAIDIGLLVVAADQGIQAQTLEHASILSLLGVERLVVAISRVDLVDVSALDDLREELEIFLDDFGYSEVPMVAVSPVANIGIDDLKQQLSAFADVIEPRSGGTYFRMPIDRVFTAPGRGCVVAGTVWSGSVNVGDSLFLAGPNETVRVREIEVHGENADRSQAGFRTALNVTGVSASDVSRGNELIQSECFRLTNHLLVELQTVRDISEIKCPATLQLHLGAAAFSARVTGVRRLFPGQSAVVLVETDSPAVATFGQKCLFRLPYPVGTVGAATVLASIGDELTRARKLVELGEQLAIFDAPERLVAWTEFLGEVDPSPAWCELQLGIPAAQQKDAIERARANDKIESLDGSDHLISRSALANVSRFVVETLSKLAEESTDAWCVEESIVQQARNFGTTDLIRRAVQSLVDEKKVVRLGPRLAIASEENVLSKKQVARMEKIVDLFDGNRSPPGNKEIAAELDLPMEAVTSLSRFAVQSGMLLDCGDGLLLSASTFGELCGELRSLFEEGQERTVAEIRDHWQVTRKHAIPFLELCDRLQATTRHENVRVPGPQLAELAAAAK